MLDSIYYYLEDYGWYLLIALIVLVLVYQQTIKDKLKSYRNRKFEQEYSAKYHKNPDLFASHVNGQKKWAEKLQEAYDRDAEKQLEKLKAREERKRQLLLSDNKEGGNVLGNSDNRGDPTTSSLRSDYNPLMGGGQGSNYRPPRRSACGGGGCG